jgi:hypothetical protein
MRRKGSDQNQVLNEKPLCSLPENNPWVVVRSIKSISSEIDELMIENLTTENKNAPQQFCDA